MTAPSGPYARTARTSPAAPPSLAAAVVAAVATALGSGGCGKTAGSELATPTAAALDHEIFMPGCAFAACHGSDTPAANLDFRGGLCGALLQRSSCLFPDKTLAVSGDPDGSFLMDKILGRNLAAKPATNCGTTNQRMPIGGALLSNDQIARVAKWISAGALCDSGGPDGGARDGGAQDGGGSGDGQSIGPRPDANSDGAHVLAFVPSVLYLRAGQRASVKVTLTPPAGPGGATVTIDTSDRNALAVPAAVFAQAGAGELQFEVLARRPASLQGLSATLGASRAEASVSIDGLFLAEVFFGGAGASVGGAPAGTDGRGAPSAATSAAQWVKLVNAGSVAVALSDYVLGSGRASYGETVGALTGVLEPGGCAVIGGPSSTLDNGLPTYDQVLDFSPDIHVPAADQPAVGIALFPAASAAPTRAPPVDAVVVGPDNAAGLIGPDGQALLPAMTSLDAVGHSLARASDGDWIDQPDPMPASCPVLR